MARNQTTDPTQAELEILQILWQAGPSTVRAVNARLQEKRPVGYTTTLKLLQIMAQKKLVLRSVRGRSHLYRANLVREQVQERLVAKLINAAFSGSAMNLVMQAYGRHKPTAMEIGQLRQWLDEMERGEK
ncbi:MAG TPA: BlaI/MecI/CopY family transcriptional regulator [bacterium]|nr:BlaI/MecI/CopY family transcriptional regulator [bacterium]HQG44891.1 BlaI/MecI/CopY family transcriptional regulator [bacterium]HQI50067.1 BlaI/MecI/CopY family transcriptional regulator [bacterium]HQJ63707.1 BlaI/MecI/CopY family transcriptional regulator [bacterium]